MGGSEMESLLEKRLVDTSLDRKRRFVSRVVELGYDCIPSRAYTLVVHGAARVLRRHARRSPIARNTRNPPPKAIASSHPSPRPPDFPPDRV
jgi:hypothetical protein